MVLSRRLPDARIQGARPKFDIIGTILVISVYLQEVHHYNAISAGLALTPTTIGILIAGALAGRLAERRTQKRLIWARIQSLRTLL